MKYDYTALYQKNADFYNRHPRLKTLLLLCNVLFSWLFFLAYLGLLAYATFSDAWTPEEWIGGILLPLFCLFSVSVLRLAVERPRPYAETGANITPMIKKTGRENKSFPSRHVASAFVISMLFTAHFPILGIPLLLCAILLAYVRFSVGAHYLADLLVGAGIGIACGAPLFF
ncbi:MAG: phosphatase PAP2 family protein [Clostridia bacterium]|nr:phosphatase PAP2 family protein [Clostridia bacterium]